MKLLVILSTLIFATGCVTTGEYDHDKAYTKCRDNPNKTSRDRCIARVIQDAERARQEQAREMQDDIDEAEQRQIDRIIAGAEED